MSVFFIRSSALDYLAERDLSCRRYLVRNCIAEFDGHVVEYELDAGQEIVVDTGHLAAMDASCQIEIKSVPGVKNMLFGGEGIFNTIIHGPGKGVASDNADQ